MPSEAPPVQELYRQLRRIRRVEEEIARIYPSDAVKSPVHLSIGQEAVAVGICAALRPDDVVSATYRGHAAYLAKGGNLNAMMAELYGKATGCARGKGGSMHLVGIEHGVLGTSAVVGTTIPIAVGHALAFRRQDLDRVVVAFLGDGATEEGVFYESLNFAALQSLPVLFVCENNGYAIHTPLEKRWATADLCRRVAGFGLPAERLRMDCLELYRFTRDVLPDLRLARGPRFLEVATYRWREHVGPGEDYDAGYRHRSALAEWQETDEVVRLGGRLDTATRAAIDAAIEAEIAAAIEFAESSPWPEQKELYAHVFAD